MQPLRRVPVRLLASRARSLSPSCLERLEHNRQLATLEAQAALAVEAPGSASLDPTSKLKVQETVFTRKKV